jgi:hypothetical protein
MYSSDNHQRDNILIDRNPTVYENIDYPKKDDYVSTYADVEYNSEQKNPMREYKEEYFEKQPIRENYTLRNLKEFLASKKYYIKSQFIIDDVIIFIKIHAELIGEDIFVYFPSKYNIPVDRDIIYYEIVPYELTDKDLLSINNIDKNDEIKENYSEVQIDDIKDLDSFTDKNYKAIDIDSNYENIIRKKMVKYTNQLNKFKNCTAKIKYKFVILTDDTLSIINRYNETENYLIKNGKGIVKNIIDSKTDTICNINHELYILIDLISFYEKINQIPEDIIKLYRNFYSILSKGHLKQTALAENRFKNYQYMISKMVNLYNQKSKYLELISSLAFSLEKSIHSENQLIQKLGISENKDTTTSSMTADAKRSFKLSKNEQELQKTREVKTKTSNLLREVKVIYHSFILTFDSSITEITSNLKNIEIDIKVLGISSDKKK